MLLSVPYWDCQQPYSDSHRPFPILGTIIWIIGALVSIISILIRIISTLIRIIGPLIRIVGPLIRINGALIRILGTLIRIIGTLIRIIGTLIRIIGTLIRMIGTVNGRLHGADWSVNLDHGIGPRQFDVYPGIDRIAFSSACPRPTQDRPKAGSAPLSRSSRLHEKGRMDTTLGPGTARASFCARARRHARGLWSAPPSLVDYPLPLLPQMASEAEDPTTTTPRQSARQKRVPTRFLGHADSDTPTSARRVAAGADAAAEEKRRAVCPSIPAGPMRAFPAARSLWRARVLARRCPHALQC